jgi:hypothetical protein
MRPFPPRSIVIALEIAIEGVVEDASAQLHEQVDATRRPLHLMLFGEALGDNLVDGGLDEGRRDCLAIALALESTKKCGVSGGLVVAE